MIQTLAQFNDDMLLLEVQDAGSLRAAAETLTVPLSDLTRAVRLAQRRVAAREPKKLAAFQRKKRVTDDPGVDIHDEAAALLDDAGDYEPLPESDAPGVMCCGCGAYDDDACESDCPNAPVRRTTPAARGSR